MRGQFRISLRSIRGTIGRRLSPARLQMSDVKITVGGRMEQEASRGFIDAWHRAERGETFRERRFAFESWRSLARFLKSVIR